MIIIKIKNNLVNLNEINTIQYDESKDVVDIYFKNGLLISIENVDQYYFKDIYNRIDNLL